jgi:hypothetical protein
MPVVMAAAWRMFREGAALHQVQGGAGGSSGAVAGAGRQHPSSHLAPKDPCPLL